MNEPTIEDAMIQYTPHTLRAVGKLLRQGSATAPVNVTPQNFTDWADICDMLIRFDEMPLDLQKTVIRIMTERREKALTRR